MNKNRWMIFNISLILSIVITILVLTGNTMMIDEFIYNIIINFKSDNLTAYFIFITKLADKETLIILSILGIILTLAIKKRIGFYLVGTLILSTIINQLLKYIIARPRPESINLIIETGYSFPSGHAMGAVSFYSFIIFIIMSSNLNKTMKWLINSLLGFLIFNICISRVYLGVHYFSDILAGFLISLCIIFITIYIIKIKEDRKDVFL